MKASNQQSNNLRHSVCKYCQMRFLPGNIPRYLSHLRNHEMKINPYWYTNPYMPPKAGCVGLQNLQKSTNYDILTSVELRMNKLRILSSLLRKKHHGLIINRKMPDKPFNHLARKKKRELIHKTNTNMHNCSYCNKTFSQIGSKERHELIHTGEKPHKCSYCNKTFNQLGHKKQHELIHTGEKPHKCSYCNGTFRLIRTKKKHELVHTGGICKKS